jgi:hypothetical protein
MQSRKLAVHSAPQSRKTSHFLPALTTLAITILPFVSTFGRIAVAQDVDPSKCFQRMLKDEFDFSQRENLLLSAMAMIDSHNYKDAGENQSLKGGYGPYKLDEKYDSWNKERNDLFSYNKLDIARYREMLLHSSWIGDRGYEVIEKCLDTQSFDQDGFRYKVEYASPTRVTIQFRWSSPQKNSGTIEIFDSTLVDGSVDGAPPGKLFSPQKPMEVGKASVPIFINRASETKDIFITLKTSLDRQPGTIRIRQSLPEKPITLKQFVVETDREGNEVEHTDTQEIRSVNDQWELSINASDGYEFVTKPTCTLTADYGASHIHILNMDWNQAHTKFTCKGTQNANPRFLQFKWKQGRFEEKCFMHCDNLNNPKSAGQ